MRHYDDINEPRSTAPPECKQDHSLLSLYPNEQPNNDTHVSQSLKLTRQHVIVRVDPDSSTIVLWLYTP